MTEVHADDLLDAVHRLDHALCAGQWATVDAAMAGDPDALRSASWLCRHCPHAADGPDSTTEQEPADALAH